MPNQFPPTKKELERLSKEIGKTKTICSGDADIAVENGKKGCKFSVDVHIGKYGVPETHFHGSCLTTDEAVIFLRGVQQGCIVREERAQTYYDKLKETMKEEPDDEDWEFDRPLTPKQMRDRT